MGTRNLTCVVSGGEYKVAQYCQWDGYPSGQGVDALEILRGLDLTDFKSKVDKCFWLDEAAEKAAWVACGAPADSAWVGMDVSDKFKEKFPHLHRDCGAQILSYVAASESGLGLADTLDFAADSLFCEWAYVVDLDKGTFEVYKGFNESPVPEGERFAFLNEKCEERKSGNTYYPIRLEKVYQLDALPTADEFNKDLAEEQDEDE